MRLRDTYPFSERLLTQPAFQAYFANARAKQLAGRRCVSGVSHRILTNRQDDATYGAAVGEKARETDFRGWDDHPQIHADLRR
ncbi:MAG TPA: hypothetical protein VM715_01365 [Candidatus Acidoferrum sp.]|nr:hypothetical protein [Candidatus Acidoferrum sp.]